MAFRVLIATGKHFHNYATLRATLDALLARRLPDVELLAVGGSGVPMLAASYAAEREQPTAPANGELKYSRKKPDPA
jgi:hypothetical protein